MPGSTCSKTKSQGQYKKLIIKNIIPFISTEQLHLSLSKDKLLIANFTSEDSILAGLINLCQLFV